VKNQVPLERIPKELNDQSGKPIVEAIRPIETIQTIEAIKEIQEGRGSKRDHESDGAPPAENSISSDAVVQSHLSLDHTRSMVRSNGRHSSEQKLRSPEEENSLGQGWNKPNVNNGVPIVSVPLPENSLGRIYSSREQTETMLRSKYNSSNEKTPLGKMQNLGDGQQRSQHVEYQYMLSIEDHAVPEKRRMGRRSSTPFTSTSSDHAEAKMASLRRAKSAEKLFVVVETVDAPPMIVFPPEKINVEEVKRLSTDLRDYKLIHNNIKNRKSSRSDGLSVNGSMDDSIALSCTGSLTSSGFGAIGARSLEAHDPATWSRWAQEAILVRDRFLRLVLIGSSIVIAQLELLHKRVTQVYGDERSSDGSITSQSRKVSVEESLAMGGSIR
jgi:hypothetical protein